MMAEVQELYNYTRSRYLERLKQISISGSLFKKTAIRKVVKDAMDSYIKDYCSRGTVITDIFTDFDFQTVVGMILQDVNEGTEEYNG